MRVRFDCSVDARGTEYWIVRVPFLCCFWRTLRDRATLIPGYGIFGRGFEYRTLEHAKLAHRNWLNDKAERVRIVQSDKDGTT